MSTSRFKYNIDNTSIYVMENNNLTKFDLINFEK